MAGLQGLRKCCELVSQYVKICFVHWVRISECCFHLLHLVHSTSFST
jgi:hypothetical protein